MARAGGGRGALCAAALLSNLQRCGGRRSHLGQRDHERQSRSGRCRLFSVCHRVCDAGVASSAALVPSANLVWGKPVTFLLLWGGWVTGAAIAFGIGNLARPLLIRLGYEKVLKKYQQLLSKRMRIWLVLLFASRCHQRSRAFFLVVCITRSEISRRSGNCRRGLRSGTDRSRRKLAGS
jgi:hypothetical protein